jgi:hypothetical protein
MASMAIDTLSSSRDLKAAEVPPIQAKAIAATIGRSAGDGLENSATKSDLTQLELRLEAKIDAKIEALRSKLIMWFVSTQIAFVAIIAAIIKL